jgi:type III pantothenate kinase
MSVANVLTIDVGNTRTKWAIFDQAGKALEQGFFVNAELSQAQAPKAWQSCDRAVLASVAHPQVEASVADLLKTFAISAKWLKSPAHSCGLKNGYQTPEKLGIDRWAAMLAGWKNHAQQNICLIVNAGTALTIDAIHQDTFVGGNIAPGLAMMRATFTDQTALVNSENGVYQAFPTNTADASYTGALNAMAGAVLLQFDRLEKLAKQKPVLVLAGGDAEALASVLQDLGLVPQVVDGLVLEGLFLIGGELQ